MDNNDNNNGNLPPLNPRIIIDGKDYGLRAGLTEIEIDEGVVDLEENALAECVGLTSAILPSSVR